MKADDIALSPSGNMASGLAGRLSGVIINTRNGEPGADGSTIRIRGQSSTVANDPLYVVDGIVREEEGGILSRFDPEDIESITVLKDASAAIYGSRAANGVILITTKRGKIGKPTLSLSYNHAFTQPTRVVNMANSASYATAQNLANEIRGISPRWTADEIQKFADGSDWLHYPNTNWYKAVQEEWTSQDKVNLQLSGGTDHLSYIVSGGFLDQGSPYKEGTMTNRMYNIRSNLDAKINDYIKITFDMFGKKTDRVLPYNGMASGSGMYSWVGLSAPVAHATWPGTDYPTNRGWGTYNPLVLSSGAAGTTNSTTWIFNGQATIDISIPQVQGLSVKGSIAYDYSGQNYKQFTDVYYIYDYDENANTYDRIMGHITAPELFIEEKRTEYINSNVRMNYLNTFADVHTVDAFVGFEQNESKYTKLDGRRTNFPTSALQELNAGDANTQTNNSGSSKTARQNYFGRLLYDYDHKYMLQFQFRYDGSHNFPSGKRFGFFPGVSGGWTMSRENFMQNMTWLSHLKVRGSWGKMGNDYLQQSFQYLTMYTLASGSVFNGTQYQGITQANAPNPYITWEKAETVDIGLETGFLNNRLTFEFDWFKTERSDILTQRNASVPSFTGLTLPAENIGKTENKGIEMMLGFRDNPNKDFSYSVSGNLTYAKNKIIFIDETPMAEAYQKSEGKPIGAVLRYKAIGIYSEADIADPNVPKRAGTVAGDIKIWDANGDGEINSLDQIRQDKTNIPDITYGINVSLSYKQFDLVLGFQGQAGVVFYLRQDWVNPSTSAGGANILQWWTEDTMTPDNPNGSKPRLGTAYGIGGTTFTQISADFFKLKTAEIGYRIPRKLVSRIGLERARVYVSGSNLFSIDKARKFGIDPEVANGGWDLNPMRLINLGINVSF
jgi:TonB-linked SusC/RagA family outer membrane protein